MDSIRRASTQSARPKKIRRGKAQPLPDQAFEHTTSYFGARARGTLHAATCARPKSEARHDIGFVLGPVHANNGLANTPFRSAGKECVAPLGRSKQATRDAGSTPFSSRPRHGREHSHQTPSRAVSITGRGLARLFRIRDFLRDPSFVFPGA